MRIEFNAGLLNQFSISVFKEHSFRFEESVDTVREGFDNVINFICNMNGGVGILQDAVDLVRRRSDADRKKTENIHEARRKCADFLEENTPISYQNPKRWKRKKTGWIKPGIG